MCNRVCVLVHYSFAFWARTACSFSSASATRDWFDAESDCRLAASAVSAVLPSASESPQLVGERSWTRPGGPAARPS